jgi:subtilisin family serine protease
MVWRGFSPAASLLMAILLTQDLGVPPRAVGSGPPPFIDPEVRNALHRGRARVLIEVRIAGVQPGAESGGREAIAMAQSRILARLGKTDYSLVRQYTTVPFLLLEISQDALPVLETMGDLVTRVLADPLRSRNGDGGSTPERRGDRISLRLLVLGLVAGALSLGPSELVSASPEVSPGVRQQLQHAGVARVIVELRLPAGTHIPEGRLPGRAAVGRQRQDIASTQSQILSRLSSAPHFVVRRFQTVPFMVLDVGPGALQELEASAFEVQRVIEDEFLAFFLAESGPLVEADQAWAAGYDGAGTVIAVIDTGVDKTHPFLAGGVVEEACYSFNGTCPNGETSQIGPGAGIACEFDPFQCFHGTHVAGIAAGNGAGAGEPFSGVARGAHLMAVQVFSRIDDAITCSFFGLPAPCALSATSDVMAGLERVYEVHALHNFSAVNMSLGGSPSSTPCDSNPLKAAIDNLRSVEIATVVSSGNSGSTDSISDPACVSSAVSVGATTKSDTIASFSNVAPFLSLMAPGEQILSSVPGGDFAVASGTSMAAPHVAGAWAILRQANPNATVSEILDTLRQTGLPVTDTRSGGSVTTPGIRIFQALNTDNPSPTIASLTPASVVAGSGAFTLTVTGSGFVGRSVVRVDGQDRPTTLVSATTLVAAIPAADVGSPGTRTITVFNTSPGGGTSSGMTLTVTPPPPPPLLTSLTPSSVNAWGPASTLTVTGSDFVSSSVVQVNGANRPTIYVSATSLTASIPASDLATTASFLTITIFTPAPGDQRPQHQLPPVDLCRRRDLPHLDRHHAHYPRNL